ncbi:MAG: 4-(cytidine 5'-diphospho)-2-C-methyl-D-erythritol kinase [Firmicutes bacterium]|nr:4-(cytidine 5'-diphospho)-2-C-methyl-D-erythritol kinase [Bacillota bacterium]
MSEVKALARAKINPVLQIGRLLPSGYHEVETILQSVELSDNLTFQLKDKGVEFLCSSSEVPRGPENLVYKAANLLLEESKIKKGARILLDKNIPVGAGLGGGSADAAVTLLSLNNLWELGIDKSRLHNLAAELGADVPFNLCGGTALARGRGDHLFFFQPSKPVWLVIVMPGFSISTAWAYKEWDKHPGKSRKVHIHPMYHALNEGDTDGIGGELYNDFEHVIFKNYPELKKIKEEIVSAGAAGALMSGSGSSVFGVFQGESSAKSAAKILKGKVEGKIFVTKTV